MTHIKTQAPAKINLTLKVTGKRDDGYHTLLSHVVFANFEDELKIDISPSTTPKISINCDGQFASDVPNENSMTKAFDLFCAHYNINCDTHIKLTKNIPSRAGLGGGSSDAAALLRALFDHFKPAQSDHDLYKIAQKIGADVPVCLREKPTLMRGTGDILEDFALKDLKLPNDLHAVLIWSDGGETTERLYKELDLADITTQNFDNDFMHVAPKLCPAINDAIDYLEQSNQCFKIGLSGSGTTVFGLCKKEFVSEPHNFSWLKTCSIITNR